MSTTMGDELVQRGRLVWSVGWIVSFAVPGCAVVVACALASGCGTSEAAPSEPVAAETAAPATATGKTEQVIQRVMPANVEVGQVEARTAAGATETAASRDARGQRRDSINSKHLEAELNRLEAELGR
jgi:hypothetical protein